MRDRITLNNYPYLEQMYFNRLFDVLAFQQERYPQEKALSYASSKGCISYSVSELIHNADHLSIGLLSKGIRKGDNIAILSSYSNSWWMLLDIALQQIGAVVVPIHATATDEQIRYILNETEAAFIFVSNTALFDRVQGMKGDCPGIKEVAFLKKSTLQPLMQHAEPKGLAQLTQIKEAIQGDALATIIYTSGTTGEPKGVMLSHRNIVSNFLSVIPLLPVKSGMKAISFLPLSHVFERMVSYAYLTMGVQIYYAKPNELMARMQDVRPNIMTCVPRLLEKMHENLLQQINGKPKLMQMLGKWAMSVGERYPIQGRLSWWYALQLLLARILVFNAVKKVTGGNLDTVVVGAAALQPRLGRLFSAVGIKIREGYGLTETSPIVAFNRFEAGGVHFGTVGIPLSNLEVKIDEPNAQGEGEIMVKGPNVMLGYHRKPDLTKSVLSEDGWFRTGDIGKIVFKRFLQITDRKKDIFKTTTGKYVAPQKLENLLKSSPYVSQCIVAGANKPFPTAVIVPVFEVLKSWCAAHNVHWTAPIYMVVNPKVHQFFSNEVHRLNETLEKHEQIREFLLTAAEWTIEKNELTPTLKPRRSILLEKYQSELEKLYHKSK